MDGLQSLVDTVVSQTAGLPTPEIISSWHPELSGDIDIRILENGEWMHEGSPILREGLVRLFASLLRREDDGEYYLVTPHEKWRIRVERHPLLVIDCDEQELSGGADGPGEKVWQALLNTGGRCYLGGAVRLHGEGAAGEPFIDVPNGLTAQFTRAAWYRLVDAATIDGDEMVLDSRGERLVLGKLNP